VSVIVVAYRATLPNSPSSTVACAASDEQDDDDDDDDGEGSDANVAGGHARATGRVVARLASEQAEDYWDGG
jgi:hypothetical protein